MRRHGGETARAGGRRMRLALLISGLRWRGRSSLAMFAVAIVAAGIAAFGPIYLHSADQTILQSTLRAAPPGNVGLTLLATSGTFRPKALAAAAREVPGAHGGTKWYGAPIITDQAAIAMVAAGQPYTGTVVARTAACAHLKMVQGSCPTRVGTTVLSTRSAKLLGVTVGDRLPLAFVRSPKRASLVISGLYAAGSPSAPFWWGANYFGYGTGSPAAPKIDDVFVSIETLRHAAPANRIASMVQLPLRTTTVDVDDVGALDAAIAGYSQRVATNGVHASTHLSSVLGQASSDERVTETIVAVVDLELTLLAVFVLYFVASRTTAQREPDVRLAELRGFRPSAALGVAMAEPIALVIAAVPVGLLLAWLVAGASAASVFGAGVGASLTLLAAGAAVAAGVAGIAATALGTRHVLGADADAAPGSAATGRRATAWRLTGDVLVVAVAAAALFELSTGGVTASSGTSVSALAAFAPGLVAFAIGVIGARLLPVALRATHKRSAGSSRIGTALATRTVARRHEFAAQVMLVALAVGLATFAVSGWAVAARNRTMRSAFDVGASKVLTVSVAPGVTFLRAVHAATPSGHDAMAVVLERASDGNTLAVDAPRMASVVSWPSTLGVSPAALAHRLVPAHTAPPVTVSGSALGVTVDTTAMDATPPPRLSMTVYDDDYQVATQLTFGTLRRGTHTYDVSLQGACPGGCRVANLALSWTPGSTPGPTKATATIVVEHMSERVGGRWQQVAARLSTKEWASAGRGVVSTARRGLALRATLGIFGTTAAAVPADVPTAEPAVVTPETSSDLSGHGGPLVVGLDGGEVSGHTVAEIPSIPGVGANAVLVNLQTAERYVNGSFLSDTTEVWLAPTTPASIVGRLRAHGVTVLTVKSAAAAERSLDHSGVSLAYLLFLIAAIAGSALAVAGTAFAIAASARRHEEELAALRAVGVQTPALGRFLRMEQWVTLGSAVVLGLLAGIVAASVALRSLPEFSQKSVGLPLDLGLPVTALVVTVGLVAVGLVATVVLGASVVVRGSTPDRLGAS